MKRNLLFLIITVLVALFSSCTSFRYGTLVSNTFNQGVDKGKVVDVALAYTKANYFLGLGGNKELDLLSLKNKLKSRYPLTDNMILANFSYQTKIKHRFLIFYTTKETVMSADVVKLDSSAANTVLNNEKYEQAYKGIKSYQKYILKSSLSGNKTVDTVKVIDFAFDYVVVANTHNGIVKFKKVYYEDLYTFAYSKSDSTQITNTYFNNHNDTIKVKSLIRNSFTKIGQFVAFYYNKEFYTNPKQKVIAITQNKVLVNFPDASVNAEPALVWVNKKDVFVNESCPKCKFPIGKSGEVLNGDRNYLGTIKFANDKYALVEPNLEKNTLRKIQFFKVR